MQKNETTLEFFLNFFFNEIAEVHFSFFIKCTVVQLNVLHLEKIFLCSVSLCVVCLAQGSPSSVLEGRCPAEFSSNPNQTHLKQLIKLLLGILETSMQVCWGKLELNSAGHWPSRTEFDDPWFSLSVWEMNESLNLLCKCFIMYK